MKLIREIPSCARLVSVSDGFFSTHIEYYKYGKQKFCKIWLNDYTFKCYSGYDCF